MYLPPVFSETDTEAVSAYVHRHPLATLVMVSGDRAHVDHIPFIRLDALAPGGRLIAHVARGNRTGRIAESGTEAMLVFTAASAYVSASFYPSKAVTHEVVPTWNYISVHVRGRLEVSHDREAKLGAVDALTRAMEAGRPAPWSVSDAPADYIERMLAGVVALSFETREIEAKVKASQNRALEDRMGVLAGLSANSATSEAAEAVRSRLPG